MIVETLFGVPGMLAETFHALSWIGLTLVMLGVFFSIVLAKLILHLIGGAEFLTTEVSICAAVAAAVLFVPVGPLVLLIIGSLLAGYGIYRRQHSRFIVTESYHSRRPQDAAVGASDPLVLLYVAVALQFLRTAEPVPSTYVWLLVGQLPLLAGFLWAYSAYAHTGSGSGLGFAGSDREPDTEEIIAYRGLKIGNVLFLLVTPVGPLTGLLLAGSPDLHGLNWAVLAAIVITWAGVLLPDVAGRLIARRFRQAVAHRDIKALLSLACAIKTKKGASDALAKLVENDVGLAPGLVDLLRRPSTPRDQVSAAMRALPQEALDAHWEPLAAFLLDASIPVSKRERVLGELDKRDCRKLLASDRNDEIRSLLSDLAGQGSTTWICWTITSIFHSLVKRGSVDGKDVLLVENQDLVEELIQTGVDGSQPVNMRAGVTFALLRHPIVQNLPDAAAIVASAKEDDELLAELKKARMHWTGGGWNLYM